MLEHPLLLSSLSPISITEILIVLAIASAAYFLVFNNFEKHVHIKRRIIKLFVIVGVLAVLGFLFGRVVFWSVITLMTMGQIYLHGWYFQKQGINGLTAEPYNKYLEVIKKMKGSKQK